MTEQEREILRAKPVTLGTAADWSLRAFRQLGKFDAADMARELGRQVVLQDTPHPLPCTWAHRGRRRGINKPIYSCTDEAWVP